MSPFSVRNTAFNRYRPLKPSNTNRAQSLHPGLVVVASLAPEPFPVASPDDDALPNSDEVHARYAAMIPEKNKNHTRMGHIAFPTAAPGRGLKRTPCRAARGDVWSRREEPCKVCECFTGGGARVVVARPGRRFSWEDVFCSEGNCVSKKPMKLNRNVREKIHLKATLPSSRGRHTRGARHATIGRELWQ